MWTAMHNGTVLWCGTSQTRGFINVINAFNWLQGFNKQQVKLSLQYKIAADNQYCIHSFFDKADITTALATIL